MVIAAEAPPLRVDDTGTIRVGNTRVTLDTVIDAYSDGATAEMICDSYDSLLLVDVYATIAYYLRHRTELDDYLSARQHQAHELRRVTEADPQNRMLRERLLARARERGLRP